MSKIRIYLQKEDFQLLNTMGNYDEKGFLYSHNGEIASIYNTENVTTDRFVLNQGVSPSDTYVGITQNKKSIWKSEALDVGNHPLAQKVVKTSNTPPELQASQALQPLDLNLQARLVSKINSVILAYNTHKPEQTSFNRHKRHPDKESTFKTSRTARPKGLFSPPERVFLVSASHFNTLLATLPDEKKANSSNFISFTKDGRRYLSLPESNARDYQDTLWKMVTPYLKEESDVTMIFDKKDFPLVVSWAKEIDDLEVQESSFDKKNTYSNMLQSKMFDEKVFNEDAGSIYAAMVLTGKEDGLKPHKVSSPRPGGESKS